MFKITRDGIPSDTSYATPRDAWVAINDLMDEMFGVDIDGDDPDFVTEYARHAVVPAN